MSNNFRPTGVTGIVSAEAKKEAEKVEKNFGKAKQAVDDLAKAIKDKDKKAGVKAAEDAKSALKKALKHLRRQVRLEKTHEDARRKSGDMRNWSDKT